MVNMMEGYGGGGGGHEWSVMLWLFNYCDDEMQIDVHQTKKKVKQNKYKFGQREHSECNMQN